MSEKQTGVVKWYNGRKGFGFISPEGKDKDVFVHASAVRDAGLKYLNENEKVKFNIQDTDKGPAAIDLEKVE